MFTKANTRRALLAATAMASFCLSDRPAHAVTFSSSPNLGITIADNAYNGTFASMASSTINVSGLPGTITDVNVTIAMQHSFIGDLTIKLVSPTGTIVTLLNRPGISTPDDGSQAGGDSSNMASDHPITYDDQAPADLAHDSETMGAPPLSDNDVVGTLGSPSTYFPDSDPFTDIHGVTEDLGQGLALYDVEIPDGVWTLYIGDSAAAALGSLDHWSLDIQTTATVVPEVNTAALAGLALVAAALGVASRRRVLPAPVKTRQSKIENGRQP